jgi:hypothetical protein
MMNDLKLIPEADLRGFLPLAIAARPQASPSIECPKIDYRAWTTWRTVGDAMSRAPVLSFGQAWLPQDEAGLAPGAVALAHDGDELIIYAELFDADIFNPVREHGAHAYQRGDVFEIFLRAEGEGNYFEHHITPDNYTLQLSFPSLTAFAENCSADPDWAKPFATSLSVPSRVFVQPEMSLWRLLAIVPLHSIATNREQGLSSPWRFSICRYDHTHGREKPALSSTTPYRFANFHHHEAWGRLSLM